MHNIYRKYSVRSISFFTYTRVWIFEGTKFRKAPPEWPNCVHCVDVAFADDWLVLLDHWHSPNFASTVHAEVFVRIGEQLKILCFPKVEASFLEPLVGQLLTCPGK
jgi:hypothetical protein